MIFCHSVILYVERPPKKLLKAPDKKCCLSVVHLPGTRLALHSLLPWGSTTWEVYWRFWLSCHRTWSISFFKCEVIPISNWLTFFYLFCSLSSLKVAASLLILAFFYDIFWVFISSSIVSTAEQICGVTTLMIAIGICTNKVLYANTVLWCGGQKLVCSEYTQM